MSRMLWKVLARDPMVLGDGRGGVPFVARQTWPLPISGTAAGMVRSSFLNVSSQVSRDQALRVLRHRARAARPTRCSSASR